ncbi:MAG: SUMF1/EgtB/PvdO family nonheme iron enzyme [Chloroflexota bacterium]|nr:SUMF1/EgtB/PvdO family nonheme iron enzyme [Chloroflexota bacterium]
MPQPNEEPPLARTNSEQHAIEIARRTLLWQQIGTVVAIIGVILAAAAIVIPLLDNPAPTPTSPSVTADAAATRITPIDTQSVASPALIFLQASTPDPFDLARTFTGSNDDWMPIPRNFDGVTMMLVPVGCFMLGSEQGAEYERPVNEQCFTEPFWIDRTKVTNAEYRRFIDAGGYADPDHWTADGLRWRTSTVTTQPRYWTDSAYNQDDQPVVGVSWHEANAYAAWRGMRLPTEAEWEYAARGVNGSVYPWGEPFDGTRLNFCDSNCSNQWADGSVDDGYSRTAPSAASQPGARGWARST